MSEETTPEVKTPEIMVDKKAIKDNQKKLQKSQSSWKGKSANDTVKVKIIKDGNFYKEGDEDVVHKATAAILKAKGLIAMFIMMIMLVAGASAQQAFNQTATHQSGTVTNTGTDTMTITFTNPGQYYNIVTIQPLVVKTSGTIAGYAILYASGNGVDYTATGDTLLLTDIARNTVRWSKTGLAVKSYRILVTGSDTMVGVCSATLIAAKQ